MKVSLIVIAAIAGLSVVSGCGGAIDEPSGDPTGDLGDSLQNPTVGDPYLDVGVLGGDLGDTGGTCDGCLPGDTGTGLWDGLEPLQPLACLIDPGLKDTDVVKEETCNYSQGYWKTHPEAWPVDGLWIGDVYYEQQQLIELMGSNTGGEMNILLRQLVAAILNGVTGTTEGAGDAYSDAIAWMDAYNAGNLSLVDSDPTMLAYTLARYNLGYMCEAHCGHEFMDTAGGLTDVAP